MRCLNSMLLRKENLVDTKDMLQISGEMFRTNVAAV